jgi:hypothetical protein
VDGVRLPSRDYLTAPGRRFGRTAWVATERDGVPSNALQIELDLPEAALPAGELPVGVLTIAAVELACLGSWWDVGCDCWLEIRLGARVGGAPASGLPGDLLIYKSQDFSPSEDDESDGDHYTLPDADKSREGSSGIRSDLTAAPLRGRVRVLVPLLDGVPASLVLTATGFDDGDVDASGTLQLTAPAWGLRQGSRTSSVNLITPAVGPGSPYDYRFGVGFDVSLEGPFDLLAGPPAQGRFDLGFQRSQLGTPAPGALAAVRRRLEL